MADLSREHDHKAENPCPRHDDHKVIEAKAQDDRTTGFAAESHDSASESYRTPGEDPSLEAGKRHVDFDIQKDQSADELHRLPLRESSSAFLASLTSASELSSPLTSPFPSSESLHSSQATRDAGRYSSIDTSSSYHREGANKSRRRSSVQGLGHDTVTPMIFPASEPTIAQRHESDVKNPAASASRWHPGTMLSVRGFDGADEQEEDKRDNDVVAYKRARARGSSTSVHSHSKSFQESGMSLSPSRFPSHTQRPSSVDPSEMTPTASPEPFFPGSLAPSSGELIEESHSNTPLLQRTDMPAPKETDQLVKDSSSMGNKLINEYEVIKKLGIGAHGTVKLAVNVRNGQKVAIKVVKRYPKKGRLGKHETPEDKVKKEVAVLKQARHPHIVSLLEVIDDARFNKVYLILEYVERGEINWRKETDKDIARFEMNRVRREIAGSVDEMAESETLARFNEMLLQRHLERTRLSLQESTLHGKEEATPQASGDAYRDLLRAQIIEPGHDAFLNPNHPPSQPSSQPASRAASRPASEYGDILSPEQTMLAPRRASHSGTNSMFINDLSGSMYGSYIEDDPLTYISESEVANSFQVPSYNAESKWTPEEKEYRYVPCLTVSEARDIFRDTILGLEYLHFHGIIHRDIKPANLLWTHDYRVKISDFGVSYLGRPMQGETNDGSDEPTISHADMSIELAKTVGTPAFYAPELCDPDLFDVQKNITRPHITGQIDVWALGVTLYAMIFGRLPFFDENEFVMYEKIAKQEAFIPLKRLRGVEDEGKVPMNSNKREDHVLQYEHVDEELHDLLRRLLTKDPTKRIMIKEVKHHPWVLRGMSDHETWIDVTDPAYKGSRRIEVSQEDVQEALVPRGWVENLKSGIQRLTSVIRGRGDSRKRAESSAKPATTSVGASSRTSVGERERQRLSLRGDESIFSALRALRDNTEHPLSQSTLASPVHEHAPSEFVTPVSYVQGSSNNSPTPMFGRPGVTDRTTSTAESIMTIKPSVHGDPEGHLTLFDDGRQFGRDSAGSSSSSISKIIDNTMEATRRIASRVRSREPGKSSREDSGSSRASSADNLASASEDHRVQPTVAVSPLIAAGRLHHPMMIAGINSKNVSPAPSPELGRDPSLESVQSSTAERGRTTQARSRANTSERIPKPASPSSQVSEQRVPSSASSDDHNASGLSEPFSPLPSHGSGASIITPPLASPPAEEKPVDKQDPTSSLMTTGETITPAIMKKYHAQQHRKLLRASRGQNDDPNDAEDEGSDDDGLVMGV